MMRLPMVEVFESIQGEGPFMGRRALFFRLAGCNLVGKCKECDTDFRFRFWMTDEEIVERVARFEDDGGTLVIFTGGEPMIYQDKISAITDEFSYKIKTQIETNGIIAPSKEFLMSVDRIVISPKRGFEKYAYNNYTDYGFKRRISDWKFVVGDVPEDSRFWSFNDIGGQINELLRRNVKKERIWLMPYGSTKDEIEKNSKKVWENALKFGVNYSDRLHIRIFKKSIMGV